MARDTHTFPALDSDETQMACIAALRQAASDNGYARRFRLNKPTSTQPPRIVFAGGRCTAELDTFQQQNLTALAPQMRAQLQGLQELLQRLADQTPEVRAWREDIDTTLRATA